MFLPAKAEALWCTEFLAYAMYFQSNSEAEQTSLNICDSEGQFLQERIFGYLREANTFEKSTSYNHSAPGSK